MKQLGRGGFTLVELLASSLITATVAGGTLMAFVTAARMQLGQENPASAMESSDLSQEVLDGLRNRVAADDTFFQTAAGTGWINAATSPAPSQFPNPPPASAGTNSIVNVAPGPLKRCYRVTAEDCDGDGTAGDCYAVNTQVCWGTLGPTCQCP